MKTEKVEEIPSIAVSRTVSPRTQNIIDALTGMVKKDILQISEKDVEFRKLHASYQTAIKRIDNAEFTCTKRGDSLYVERTK